MSQIELFNHLTMCKQMTDIEVLMLYLKPFKHAQIKLTVSNT